ncbi:hypothetical protein ABZT02_45245 [Streptomyces sp. NPDC005402]|uniref:hypothetical protein n=1 Tax=Streptomyces sp. NPDC005402 TaxID=3155338 RepID=UPI00339FED9C
MVHGLPAAGRVVPAGPGQLSELSPVVQALPPTAALVELKGALPYYGVDAGRLGEVLRIRTLSRLGSRRPGGHRAVDYGRHRPLRFHSSAASWPSHRSTWR